MRIFLAGATGAIGRRLLPLLLADGHQVTAMVRSPGAALARTSRGWTPRWPTWRQGFPAMPR